MLTHELTGEDREIPGLVAHTPGPGGRWHSLGEHSLAVARLAKRLAAVFGCGDWAFLLGQWHDLGKSNPKFQAYLVAAFEGRTGEKCPHAIWGAALAYDVLWRDQKNAEAWKELAIPIAGHHAGLACAGELSPKLEDFLNGNPEYRETAQPLMEQFPKAPYTAVGATSPTVRELRIRMAFSALVDADFLDTERHFNPGQSLQRGEWARPIDLWPIFRADQLRVMWNGRGTTALNRIRRSIYFDCLRAAKAPPGLFRLTVPTGGGKTRAALAFALRHAVENPRHGFRRIIAALPYTSIIDQTAGEYRRIFGERLVLEHHSQFDASLSEDQDQTAARLRLCAENWDHPLVITTTVQLFESLFASSPSRCRKLHNIARSILILDEAQTLPPELLKPTLDVLRTLIEEYGVTVVLSTATQPAFDATPYLSEMNGLHVGEIVPEPERLFANPVLKRVEYQPLRHFESLDALAAELCKPEARRVLVVLNTRKHALELHSKLLELGAGGVMHLSTLLCGAHRRVLLSEIKRKLLTTNDEIRLISTQVVEAGVDLDFPLLYRALGPLDRIVQAAGRCNREGRLPQPGQVVIFDWPGNASPPGAYKIGIEETRALLANNEPERLHDPSFHTEYFQRLFRDVDLDKRRVQSDRRDLNYPIVSEKYRFIEDTFPVVIPKYANDEGRKRLAAHLASPSRESWRRLAAYTVSLAQRDLAKWGDFLESVTDGLYLWKGAYDDETHRGIEAEFDPHDLMV